MKKLITFLFFSSLFLGCSFGTSLSKNSSGTILSPLKFEKNEKGILKVNPTLKTDEPKPQKNNTAAPETRATNELPPLPSLKPVEQNGRKENIARIDAFLQTEINNKTEKQIVLEQKPTVSKENIVPVFKPEEKKALKEKSHNNEDGIKIHWAKLFLFYLSIFSFIYLCYLIYKNRKKIHSLLFKRNSR